MPRTNNASCVTCGKEFYKRPSSHNTLNCSKECKLKHKWIVLIQRVEKDSSILLKEWISNAYLIDFKTYRMISKEITINERTVKKLLEYFEIPIRHGSEAISAQWHGDSRRDNRREPNKYIITDDCCEIVCHNKKKEVVGALIIDIEDIDKCSEYHWSIGPNGYGISHDKKSDGGKHVKIHRFLTGVSKDKEIDHRNRKRYDNRRTNLRECTRLQNAWNRGLSKKNTSGYKGVNKRDNKWIATIGYKGKSIWLGTFKTKEEAIKVRSDAEDKYYGEYKAADF